VGAWVLHPQPYVKQMRMCYGHSSATTGLIVQCHDSPTRAVQTAAGNTKTCYTPATQQAGACPLFLCRYNMPRRCHPDTWNMHTQPDSSSTAEHSILCAEHSLDEHSTASATQDSNTLCLCQPTDPLSLPTTLKGQHVGWHAHSYMQSRQVGSRRKQLTHTHATSARTNPLSTVLNQG
jgi:hypothetical protein